MSITLDFSAVWTQASDFVNSMWPIFVIPLGLVLGTAILSMIVKQVKSALGGL